MTAAQQIICPICGLGESAAGCLTRLRDDVEQALKDYCREHQVPRLTVIKEAIAAYLGIA